MGLMIGVTIVAFLCGVALTGTIACFVVGLIHEEAVKIVDSHLMLAGIGGDVSFTTHGAPRQAHG